ncbi:hypothetical protein [Kitasatospora azatica]|uniref:hypothetical protein n=1 Tax=Kitasatospora azatica TaxID=58347 RepID=UPI00056C3283|nr:hypothetical protein [Kitasatospora azatica]
MTPDWTCGTSLTSNTVHLVFQCDGNLVLYRNSDGHAMWAAGSDDGSTGFANHIDRVNFHSDGTIHLWHLGTFPKDECTINAGAAAPFGHMSVQDDGNLVVYTDGGHAVWSSNTYNNMQGILHACPI